MELKSDRPYEIRNIPSRWATHHHQTFKLLHSGQRLERPQYFRVTYYASRITALIQAGMDGDEFVVSFVYSHAESKHLTEVKTFESKIYAQLVDRYSQIIRAENGASLRDGLERLEFIHHRRQG